MISNEGIAANTEKISAITNFPPPQTKKALQSFLGMTGYFSRFIPRYSDMTAPLTNLMKGVKQKNCKISHDPVPPPKPVKKTEKIVPWWSPHCQENFDKLKVALTNMPVLAYPDPNSGYEMYTDASELAIAGLLLQNGRLIACHSRKYQAAEKNYSTYDKEALALAECVKK